MQENLRVALSETAGMSPSAFREHFRAVRSLTPLQFLKPLRLIEVQADALGDICDLYSPYKCWNYLKAAGYASD